MEVASREVVEAREKEEKDEAGEEDDGTKEGVVGDLEGEEEKDVVVE